MAKTLPQQQLLLELLHMSGEIAILGEADGSVLWRTLHECRNKSWVKLTAIGDSGQRAEITPTGRMAMTQGANEAESTP